MLCNKYLMLVVILLFIYVFIILGGESVPTNKVGTPGSGALKQANILLFRQFWSELVAQIWMRMGDEYIWGWSGWSYLGFNVGGGVEFAWGLMTFAYYCAKSLAACLSYNISIWYVEKPFCICSISMS